MSQIEKTALVTVRDGRVPDLNFIFATWLRGLRHGNDFFDLIESDTYFGSYHAVVNTILTTPGVQVKIACLKDDPEVILGYSVYRDDTIDWIFVKKAWRSIGIAKMLTPPDLKYSTHFTKVGIVLLRKYGISFNPFNLP